MDDEPEAFIDRQLTRIAGFEMPIERLEGAWKVSQNRSPADRAGVVAGLSDDGDPGGLEIAALVAALDR